MRTLKIVTAIIVFMSLTLFAQDEDMKKYPGYFDFGDLTAYDQGEEGAEVYIQEHLLKMVAKMAGSEDPELQNILNGLKLVKVNTFEMTKKNSKSVHDKLSSIQNTLKNNNWDKIVRVREKGNDMSVFIKTDRSQKINGLVVAGIGEDNKAVFVNIVGDIDLEALGKLGDKFDIPSLGDINKKKD